MDFEKRLSELFIELPEAAATPHGSVRPVVVVGKTCHVAQQLPIVDGKLVGRGKLGFEVSPDQGVAAARHALIQALSALRAALGSLNKVKQVIRLEVWLATAPDFKDQDRVADGASQLLQDIFGPSGTHVRSVVGVSSLPRGACLSLTLLVETK